MLAEGERQRVLLIDGDAAQLARVESILKPIVTGGVDSRARLGDSPADHDYDLVVVNYDTIVAAERQRVFEAFAGVERRTRLLLIAAGRARLELPTLFGQHALTNLLANDGQIDADDLAVTVRKILRRDVFGVEKYFSAGAESVLTRLTRSSDKARLVAVANQYATDVGLRSRMASMFCTVADELVTNAIYNAPRGADGRQRYSHLSRASEVVLEAGEEIEVKFCCDGRRLGISASDPFGSLTPATLLDYLSKCIRAGDDQVDDKPGGAGLGFYYIFQAVSHFVVNIAPRIRTEVIGLIDIRTTYRQFANSGKSFNIFLA